MKPANKWKNKETTALAEAFLKLKTDEEVLAFLRDILTVNEIQTIAQRWQVARLLHQGKSFKQIEHQSGASSATITRVNHWLKYGMDGYKTILARLK